MIVSTEVRKSVKGMVVLILAGESAFILPFVLQRVFRPTFLEVYGLNNYQLGICFSVYGLVALFSYFFGGSLADRFSPRILMSVALLLTALGGVWMAFYPSYTSMQWLYGYWGFTTIFLFWGALIKQTNIWGGADKQGLAFGFLDGGRGLVSAILSSLGAWIFASYLLSQTSINIDVRQDAFRQVVLFTSLIVGLAGVLVLLLLGNEGSSKEKVSVKTIFEWSSFKQVLKLPSIWLLSLIVLSAYMGYKVTDIFSLYAKEVMKYSEIESAGIGALLMYLRPVIGVLIGLLTDRTRGTLVLFWGFFVLLLGSLVFASGAIDPDFKVLFFIGVLLTAIGTFATRAIYFAIMKEGNIPAFLTGTAVGIVSFIGYTPDIFSGPLIGDFLDQSPGEEGHIKVFALLACYSLMGMIATVVFRKISMKTVAVKNTLSYATPQDPWITRIVIKGVEVVLGRKKIEKVYDAVLKKGLPPSSWMGAALDELNIPLSIKGRTLESLPTAGPIIFIANHPFGVVDGLAMAEIVSRVRKDFGILVNSVLCRDPQLDPYFLPIDFREIPEALRTNINTRKEALERLKEGQAIAIFPSGAVATAPVPGKKVEELEWKRFVVKLITQSNARVIPIYFYGENSFWFQVASYLHASLRLGLLLHEVTNKRGKDLRIAIGAPITPEEWKTKDPIKELLPFLRERTMSLATV